MNCLYLDASRSSLGLAVQLGDIWIDAGVLDGRHDAVLLPTVTRVLAAHATSLEAIDSVVCVHGPGSFTGLRITVAAVHALHLVTQCQVLPVDQLSLMAFVAQSQGLDPPYDVVLDARMGDAYAGYGGWRSETPQLVQRVLVSAETVEGTHWIGHSDEQAFLSDRVKSRVSPTLTDLRSYAEACAGQQWISGDQLTPLYLRQTISWVPLAEQPSKLYES